MKTKTASAIFATWILASLLAACGGSGPPAECPPNVHPAFCAALPGGGGGGGNSNDPAASAGLWQGSMSNGRESFAALLSDGTYWFFYSAVGDTRRISGLTQGTATSIGGTLISTTGQDFNLEGLGVNPATLTANYVPQTSLNGTIRYPEETVSFSSSHVTFTTPTFSQIAGSYRGDAAVVDASDIESVNFTVGAGGTISGALASGCHFTGAATPRSDVAVFDLTVTFVGGGCALGTATVRGIAFYDEAVSQLLIAAVDSTRNNALIALGTKR